MAVINRPIFDKIVNLRFYKRGGGFDEILMPPTGIKPNITIQGSYITSDIIGSVNLRIVNFYSTTPLNEYEYIEIFCGYRGSLTGTIKGQVWIAYQESPSPDGVTYFQLQTAGSFTGFVNAIMARTHWDLGCQVNIVLQDIVDAMTAYVGRPITLQSTISQLINLTHPLDYNGVVKDLMTLLQGSYIGPKFNYRMDGDTLFVWPGDGSTQRVFPINYFSSPPTRFAAGMTFSSPWFPDLRPGDIIQIDPKYSKQTYTGSITELPRNLVVQSIEYEFNTVIPQNHMSVYALNTAAA
jgi:hypothetical protein